jgi:nicotinic acid phosphoribosyltransferase
MYVAVYVWSGSAPFSWHIAMDRDPDEVAAMRAFVETLNEAEILVAFDEAGGGRGER